MNTLLVNISGDTPSIDNSATTEISTIMAYKDNKIIKNDEIGVNNEFAFAA